MSAVAVSNGLVYLSSGDRYLYVFNARNGMLQNRYEATRPFNCLPVAGDRLLYIDENGVSALDTKHNAIIWHDPFGASPSVYFNPLVAAGQVVYVVRIDGRGNSTLYALNAATGTEYWHVAGIEQITPLIAA